MTRRVLWLLVEEGHRLLLWAVRPSLTMLGLSLMLLVAPLSAGDEQPLRLYMPDGQLKSHSIRVSEGIR